VNIDDLGQMIRNDFIDATNRRKQARWGFIEIIGYTPPPRWDGGRDSSRKIHLPIWPTIAAFTLRNELDPLAHIRAQFDDNPRLPTPGFLLTKESLDRYRSKIASFEKELLGKARFQAGAALTEVNCLVTLSHRSALECWVRVLWGDPPELQPLFRHCMAVRLIQRHGKCGPLIKLREAYRDAAHLEFLGYPGLYRKIWADLIPEELVQLHSSLRSSVAGESQGQATPMCETGQVTQHRSSSGARPTPDPGVQRSRLSGALTDTLHCGTPRGNR